jgi:hypothetical protein
MRNGIPPGLLEAKSETVARRKRVVPLTFYGKPLNLARNMPPGDAVYGDPTAVTELFKEFGEWYRLFAADLGTVADKAIDMNKQIGAFHERMLLVNVGTIGISVSALISLGAKVSTNASGKNIFVYCVAPAWVLLFLSVWTCRNVMAFTLRINREILKDWAKRLEVYYIQQALRSANKLSKALSGTVRIDSTPHDVSVLFAGFAKSIEDTFAQQRNELLVDVTKSDSLQLKRQSIIAAWSMQIGLVLLCIAAIRLFLM